MTSLKHNDNFLQLCNLQVFPFKENWLVYQIWEFQKPKLVPNYILHILMGKLNYFGLLGSHLRQAIFMIHKIYLIALAAQILGCFLTCLSVSYWLSTQADWLEKASVDSPCDQTPLFLEKVVLHRDADSTILGSLTYPFGFTLQTVTTRSSWIFWRMGMVGRCLLWTLFSLRSKPRRENLKVSMHTNESS